jgi:hypothetical protein
VVGTEVGERGVKLVAHLVGVVRVWAGSGEVADLAGEHQVVAADLAHQAAEETFRAAEAVDVGGVVEGDAELVGGEQCGEGLVRVDVVPADRDAIVGGGAADGPASGADRGDFFV